MLFVSESPAYELVKCRPPCLFVVYLLQCVSLSFLNSKDRSEGVWAHHLDPGGGREPRLQKSKGVLPGVLTLLTGLRFCSVMVEAALSGATWLHGKLEQVGSSTRIAIIVRDAVYTHPSQPAGEPRVEAFAAQSAGEAARRL